VGGKQGAATVDPAQATSAPVPAAATPAVSHHRTPGIQFPPRITADGRRISLLPAAEATAIMQQWLTSATASPAAPPAATAPSADVSSSSAAAPSGSGAANVLSSSSSAHQLTSGGAVSQATAIEPSKFASAAVRLERMPARRELTEKEMELIELGGAL